MKKILLSAFAFTSLALFAQTTQFYAPTQAGGTHGGGIIYSVDGAGNNYQKRLDFDYNTAISGFCEGINGKMYGAGGQAGTFVDGSGTIYEYDVANNIMYEKYTFTSGQGGPSAPMILAPNNKMYGVCRNYGSYGQGYIFEYDYVNNIVTIKYHFDGPVNGGQPTTKLLLASNGKLYGATRTGTSGNYGSMFEYDYINNVFTKKAKFNVFTTGYDPGPYMAQGTNQKIYGHVGNTTPQAGALFEYNIALDTVINVHTFNTTTSGVGIGVIHINGKMYGTTPSSGANGLGNLYEYDYNTATYTSLWDFNYGTAGTYPGTVPVCINNKLYFFNQGSGSFTYGTFVSYDLSSSAQNVLYQFNTPGPIQPGGDVIYSNGKIYCRSNCCGFNIFGTMFTMDTLGNETDLLPMAYSAVGNYSNDLLYFNGNLYATGLTGGQYNQGIIYKYDPSNQQFTKLWDFDNFGNGTNPAGPLIPSSGTNVYGVTQGGGGNNDGQVYEFDLVNGIYSPLLDLNSSPLGSGPTGYLVKHGNGKLYGTCSWGGVNNTGTLFECDPVNATGIKRYDFSNPSNGQKPDGIVLGANGKIYGVATASGTNNNGTFFEFTPPSTFVKKFAFSATSSGDYPVGKPLEVSPGIFYGLTRNGGTHGQGVLYKYKVSSNTFTKLVDFDSLDLNKGSRPNCSLTMGAGGKIYGTTLWGGASNLGIMFEFDTLSGVITKKIDFNGTNGRSPGSLTLVCGTTTYDAGTSSSLCRGGQYVLGTTPDAGYSYSWSSSTGLTGATTANPTVTVQNNPITYSVTESYLGCVTTDQITITPLLPQTPQICLVTDDSADVYNHVIWEKSLYSGVDSFIVYREISTGNYARIGAVSNDSLSVFIDTMRLVGPANGDPRLSTYRYKISIKDTCGNEGAMSPWHTTIYFNDLHNGSFQWNTYAVENMTVTPISTYELLRDSNNTGFWKVIASCAGTSNILVDPQYSTFQNVANWRVQANGIACTPTMRYANNSVQGQIIKSKSNISNNRTMGVRGLQDKSIALYPNPFSDKFTVISEEKGIVTIHNSLGELVHSGNLSDKTLTIDLANSAAGVYNVTIRTEKGVTIKKIVKQ